MFLRVRSSWSLRLTTAPKVVEELVLKRMGYKVVNIPHWHWNKLKVRKTRIEYVRRRGGSVTTG